MIISRVNIGCKVNKFWSKWGGQTRVRKEWASRVAKIVLLIGIKFGGGRDGTNWGWLGENFEGKLGCEFCNF